MGKAIKITFTTTGFTYDVYTGPSESGPYTSYAIGVTGSSIVVSGTTISSFTGKTIYVKVNCLHCKDEIFPVKLMQDPLRLTGYTTNVTCPDNAESSTDYENNGTLRIYTGSGLPHPTSGYTFYITGPDSYSYTTTGTSITDLSSLSGGIYTVNAFDYMSGTTGNASFTVPERSGFGDNPGVITKPTCVGGADGSITLTYSGGAYTDVPLPSPPYVFEWYNGSTLITGATGSTLSSLSAGTYKSKVYIKNTVCYDEITYTVADPEVCNPPLNVSATLVNIVQPTPTPTETPTPTPTEVTVTLKYHGTLEPTGSLDCNSGTDIQVVMNSANFCTATTYNSSYFTSLGTGTFWISYNAKYRQIFHTSSSQSATQSGNCKDCVGVTPTYYWYALGDCQNMRYTYTQVTNTGMGIITIPGLCGLPSEMDYSDPAHTAYYFDTSNPCGFGTGYTGTYNARSSTQLTEGDVYTISGVCYSVIELNSEPPTWTIDMDGRTKETGANPCFDCQPPFTGFTYYSYSGVTCDNVPDEIIVYDISPYVLNNDPLAIRSPQIGQKFLYHAYDANGTLVNPGNSCVTITGYIGEFVGPKVVVPLPGGNPGTTYSVPVGPILTGGGEITNCNQCIPHWNITTERCDGQVDFIGYPIWSTTKPAINSVIETNANDGVCRKVTEVFPIKFIPYLGGFIGSMHTQIYYVSSSYADCPICISGGTGTGDTGNIGSISGTSTANQSTYSECSYPNTGTYYNEYSENVTVTFYDTNGNPATPNGVVKFSSDGGQFNVINVTVTTYSLGTFTWRDATVCTTADRIVGRIKINDVSFFTWTAGIGQS